MSVDETCEREKKSYHIAMVEECLDVNKPNMAEKMKTLICMTFMCMIALRNKTVVHTFLPSFNNTMAVSIKKDYCDPKNFEIIRGVTLPAELTMYLSYVVKFRVVKKDSARVAKERL